MENFALEIFNKIDYKTTEMKRENPRRVQEKAVKTEIPKGTKHQYEVLQAETSQNLFKLA